MTIWGILSLLCRMFGIVKLADSLWEKHKATVKARSEANAPITDSEEANDLLR